MLRVTHLNLIFDFVGDHVLKVMWIGLQNALNELEPLSQLLILDIKLRVLRFFII